MTVRDLIRAVWKDHDLTEEELDILEAKSRLASLERRLEVPRAEQKVAR